MKPTLHVGDLARFYNSSQTLCSARIIRVHRCGSVVDLQMDTGVSVYYVSVDVLVSVVTIQSRVEALVTI